MDVDNFYQHRTWSLGERHTAHRVKFRYCPMCGYERPYFMFAERDTICKYHTEDEIELWMWDDEDKKKQHN